MYSLQSDPTSLEEALSSTYSDFWREAINDEMDSLISNNTWKLVDLPPGWKTIGCKWLLRRKLKPDGTIEKFKARLSDYFDTFSPVTKITSVRLLIAIAAIYNLMIHQIDVKTAVDTPFCYLYSNPHAN